MSERFVYLAFLTVLFTGLLAMTVALVAIVYFLFRQNQHSRTGGPTRPSPDA